MTKEDAIERVKKLLRLSGSANENEALLALSNAEKLMRRFSIEQIDLAEDCDITQKDFVHRYIRKWEQLIAQSVANLFFCKVAYHTTHSYHSRSQSAHFIGMKTNIQTCEEVFNRLIEWVNMRACFMYPGSGRATERNRYKEGSAIGIWKRCVAIVKEREEAKADKALVVVQDKLEEYIKDYSVRNHRSGFNQTRETLAGYRDSKEAPLFPQVGDSI